MLQKLFGFNPVQHKVRIEIYAGITTFLTMAYILAMNPSIFSALEPQVILANFNNPSILLALIGLVVCGLMVVRSVKGGLLWGILITTLIGIPMGVTYFDKILSAPPSLAPVFLQFEWHHIFSLDMLVVVMTFLFVDLFDTIGTVIAVSLKADMVDKEGRIAGVGRLLMTDAIATTAGAMRRRACRSYHYDCSQSDQIIEKMSIQQPVLLKKSFQELTVNELYELLRVPSCRPSTCK